MVMGDRIKPAAQQAMRQAKQRTGTVTSSDKPNTGEKADQAALPTRQTDQETDDAARDDVDD